MSWKDLQNVQSLSRRSLSQYSLWHDVHERFATLIALKAQPYRNNSNDSNADWQAHSVFQFTSTTRSYPNSYISNSKWKVYIPSAFLQNQIFKQREACASAPTWGLQQCNSISHTTCTKNVHFSREKSIQSLSAPVGQLEVLSRLNRKRHTACSWAFR